MADTSVIFNILAKDNASSVFKKIAATAAGTAIGFVTGNLALGGLNKAFDFAKQATFGFNSQLQNADIAFTTMLGSGTKAQTFLSDLQKFAKSTPFEFPDLVTASQRLIAMGINSQSVIPYMTAIGDAVAGLGGGADKIDQVTNAIGQMSAKGKVQSDEILQLTEAGIPALRILADAYGTTTGNLQDMISKGKIASADALPKLMAGLENGTKSTAGFGGMMAKQSQTFSGALSNIKDGLTQAVAGAFKPFFDVASKGALALGNFFSGDKFAAFGTAVSGGIKTAIDWVKAFIKNTDFTPVIKTFGNVKDFIVNDIIPVAKDLATTFLPPIKDGFKLLVDNAAGLSSVLGPIGDFIKGVFGFIADHSTSFQAIALGILAIVAAVKAWNLALSIWQGITRIATIVQAAFNLVMAMNPIALVILAVIGLVAAFVYLWTHSAAFRDFFIGMWNHIWGFIKGIGQWFAGPFVNFFKGAWKFIKDGVTGVWHWIVDKFNAVVGFVKDIPKKISTAASGMWDGIKNAFKGALNWIISKWNGLQFSIPGFSAFGLHVGGFTLGVPQIPMLASGGVVAQSGMAIVGERGPELLSLTRGAQVQPLNRSTAGSYNGMTVVQINGGPIMDRLLTDIAKAVQNKGGRADILGIKLPT